MQDKVGSPHGKAWSAYGKHLVDILGLLAFQVLLRLVALAPLIYVAMAKRIPGLPRNYLSGIGLLACIPLYVLLVLPFRFQTAARFNGNLGRSTDSRINGRNYGIWLKAGLYRLMQALPFVLPFLVFCGLFYYYINYPDFNVPYNLIKQVGSMLGGVDSMGLSRVLATGIGLILLAGLGTGILAGYGWRRGLGFDFQNLQGKALPLAWRDGRAAMKRSPRHLSRVGGINFLLCLPALLGLVVVLLLYFQSLPSFSLAMDFIRNGTLLLSFQLPAYLGYILLGLLLLIWIPLLPVRKLALAALLGDGRP